MFSALSTIWHFLENKHREIYIGIFTTFLESTFVAMPIFALYIFLRNIFQGKNTSILLLTGIILIGLIGQLISHWYTNTRLRPLGFKVMEKERLAIGDRLKNAPMGYFNRNRLGKTASILTTILGDAEMYIMAEFLEMTASYIKVVVISLFLLFFDWKVGLFSLFIVLLASCMLRIIEKRSDKVMLRRQQVQQRFVDTVLEFIRGISVSRAFSLTGVARKRMHEASHELSQAALEAESKIIPFAGFYRLIYKIGTVGIIFLGGWFFLSFDTFDASRALLFVVIAFVVYVPLENLNITMPLLELVAKSLSLVEPVRKMPAIEARGEIQVPRDMSITFDDVSFAYEERPIITHVSAQIPAQSTCAIVGPSGSGKTTLCNLIMRFWDVDEGAIKIGGVDIRDQDPNALLKLFSVVFQDVYLFSDTVRNNIAFGHPDATDMEIREAARRARCLDLIDALPDGFDTVLNEGGSSLSGGERQRISIARAILKDSPIIILDEATSSVDPENERDLQQALDELCADKTRVVIAHNLNTVREADQILVLTNGSIAESGTHDELATMQGEYRRFLDARKQATGWSISR